MSLKPQADNILPPVLGQVIAIVVDATPRSYDWGPLAINGLRPLAQDPAMVGEFFVSLICDTTINFAFGPEAATIDGISADAAGADPPTLRADAPFTLPANQVLRYRVSRVRHRFIHVVGAVGGTIRMVISSPVDMQQ